MAVLSMHPNARLYAPVGSFRWTDANVDKLREFLEAGVDNPVALAQALGTSPSVVAAKLLRGDYARVRPSGKRPVQVTASPDPDGPPPATTTSHRPGDAFSWHDPNVALLKRLWDDGLSASAIAARMPGSTRSGVLGKVHRLDLPGRAKGSTPGPRGPRKPRLPSRSNLAGKPPAPRRPQAAGAAPPTPRVRLPPRVPIEDLVVPVSLNVSLLSLNDQMCKWPIGDPAVDGFHFCGHRNFNGTPYCEYHARLAYQPVADRRRERDARY